VSSFTEIVVSFNFVDSTPPEIVAAFSPWRVAGESDEISPELPEHRSIVRREVEDIFDDLADYEVITPFSSASAKSISELYQVVWTLSVADHATLLRIALEGTSPYYFPVGTSTS
jgi:hypothetical protein